MGEEAVVAESQPAAWRGERWSCSSQRLDGRDPARGSSLKQADWDSGGAGLLATWAGQRAPSGRISSAGQPTASALAAGALHKSLPKRDL